MFDCFSPPLSLHSTPINAVMMVNLMGSKTESGAASLKAGLSVCVWIFQTALDRKALAHTVICFTFSVHLHLFKTCLEKLTERAAVRLTSCRVSSMIRGAVEWAVPCLRASRQLLARWWLTDIVIARIWVKQALEGWQSHPSKPYKRFIVMIGNTSNRWAADDWWRG